MKQYKVLASESFKIPATISDSMTIDVIDDLWKDTALLVSTAIDYDALIVRNMTQIDATLMDQLTSIKVIGRLGAGIENIDVNYAKQNNINVVYAPVQNTNAVAEYCVAQVFNAFRHLPQAMTETQQGLWNRAKYLSSGKEIKGSTIGVIGFGHIGKAFAEKMHALGANVLIHNRTATNIDAPFQQTDLTTLLATSDLISLHLPGGEFTKDFINANNLKYMKSSAYLMNSARGSIINEDALLAAITSKKLGGAILDVRSIEPATADTLAQYPNVYVTPHIAAFTQESQMEISASVINDVLKVLQNETPSYPVHLV
jgi:phosphoglycerate dehydrogenase-like enzyme